jgi:hypothetical protein
MKEVELAKYIIESLIEAGYDIYQEVAVGDGVVDIVVKGHNFYWAIETKTSFSFDVLSQARRNIRYFNFSSIGVPGSSYWSKGRNFARDVAETYGIGIFEVNKHNIVHEVLRAKFNRKAYISKINLLEEHKFYAEAGNAEGKYFTPFQDTKRNLIKYIQFHNGCSLKHAMNAIRHHYASLSSATNSMRQWIKDGIIKELYIENGKVYLKENKDAG